jgi:hypothetical protein
VPHFAAMKALGKTTRTIVAMAMMPHPGEIIAGIDAGLIAGRLT